MIMQFKICADRDVPGRTYEHNIKFSIFRRFNRTEEGSKRWKEVVSSY